MEATVNNNDRALFRKKVMPILMVYGVLVLMLVIAQIVSPGFLELSHMDSLLRQMAFLGIVCIGQNLVIITGGIDLSLRYTLVLCNVVSAQVIAGENGNNLKAFVICMLISAAIGIVNGLGIYFLQIPAMIMTLATGYAVWGIAYIYCNGAPKGRSSEFVSFLANQKIGGVINGVTLIWIILTVAVVVMMTKTIFGRSLYAIGVNKTASNYSGISAAKMYIGVYLIAALLAGLAGYLFLGYTGTSYLSTAESYNMDSIASVVIGGTSVMGGSGSYIGTIAGVGIMVILSSLMTVLNMAESGKQMAQGAIIIIVLLFVYAKRGRKES